MLRACLLAALICAQLGPLHAQAQNGTVDTALLYDGHSAKMREAIDKARGSLNEAIEAASQGQFRLAEGFAMKVAIRADAGIENIWVDSLERDETGFIGRFASEPKFLPDKRLGSAVTFGEGAVIDWALPTSNGKFWGHYTTRVILQNMAPEDGRRIRSRLALRPAPRSW